MKLLLQRVSYAKVEVDQQVVGQIDAGLLVFLAVEPDDTEQAAKRLMDKMLAYRVFSDNNQQMNLSVTDVNGGVLLVSQFTLAANTQKGLRPSFSCAAPPALAESIYQYSIDYLKSNHKTIATGEFGADMQVTLCNDGPVTFLI